MSLEKKNILVKRVHLSHKHFISTVDKDFKTFSIKLIEEREKVFLFFRYNFDV